jgi:hypothetical protein
MNGFKWENPPSTDSTRTVHGQFAAAADKLRGKPNRWARVRVYDIDPSVSTTPGQRASQFAHNIRTGKVSGFHTNGDGEFEARGKTLDDGRGAVYVRFVTE